jgi:hypothetical protein
MDNKTEEITKTVLLVGLGLCEHCGTLITMEDMPSDSTDAIWCCPKCQKVITEKSFGYEKGKKILWVGKDGKWTNAIPTSSWNGFILGTWKVIIKTPPTLIY